LNGCATYTPLPLGPGYGAARASGLGVSAASMPTRVLARHRFDPSDGLDVNEVAMLAVANNPLLKVLRDQTGAVRAQAFDAGLLPDPQLGVGADFPTGASAGASPAFNLGLSEDLGAWLTRSTRVAAARDRNDQADLERVWAEWQTVARARLLFEQIRDERARESRLRHETQALAPLDTAIQAALATGNLTHADATSGFNALADAQGQLAETTRARKQSNTSCACCSDWRPRHRCA